MDVDRGLEEEILESANRVESDRDEWRSKKNNIKYSVPFLRKNILLECCDGGLRLRGGTGGTNVVRSNSFSSLLIGINDDDDGGSDKSTSLTYFVEFGSCCSCSVVIGERETVTLIYPGCISRRTASCKVAAASKFDIFINDESLITRS